MNLTERSPATSAPHRGVKWRRGIRRSYRSPLSNRVSPGKYPGTGVKINGEERLTLKRATFWQLWSNCEVIVWNM